MMSVKYCTIEREEQWCAGHGEFDPRIMWLVECLPRDCSLATLRSAAPAVVGVWLDVCHVRVLCRNG